VAEGVVVTVARNAIAQAVVDTPALPGDANGEVDQ
jgi:hypothetical protein